MIDTRSITRLVLEAWPTLKWRHHGAGLLQAYVDKTRRVHIWHKSLILPGMTESGGMHNHRFDFRSTVLCGSIHNTPLFVKPNEFGDHRLWEIVGASDKPNSKLVPGLRVNLYRSRHKIIEAGHSYSTLKWDFHWARPYFGVLAVTFVELENKESERWAHLVAPVTIDPVHAFEFKSNPEDTEYKDRCRRLIETARFELGVGKEEFPLRFYAGGWGGDA